MIKLAEAQRIAGDWGNSSTPALNTFAAKGALDAPAALKEIDRRLKEQQSFARRYRVSDADFGPAMALQVFIRAEGRTD